MDLVLVMKERLRDQSVEVRTLSRRFTVLSALGTLMLFLAFVFSPQMRTTTVSVAMSTTSSAMASAGFVEARRPMQPQSMDDDVASHSAISRLSNKNKAILAREQYMASYAPLVPVVAVEGAAGVPKRIASPAEAEKSLSNSDAEKSGALVGAALGRAGANGEKLLQGSGSSATVSGGGHGADASVGDATTTTVVTSGSYVTFLVLSAAAAALLALAVNTLMTSRFISHYYSPTGLAKAAGPFQLTTYVASSPDPQSYRGVSMGGQGFRMAPISSPNSASSPQPNLSSIAIIMASPTPAHLFLFPLHWMHYQLPMMLLFAFQQMAALRSWPWFVMLALVVAQFGVWLMRSRLLWSIIGMATSSR